MMFRKFVTPWSISRLKGNALLLFALMLGIGEGEGSAVRDLVPTAQPGASVEVTIIVEPSAGTGVYAVEERVPSGTVVSRISDDGSFDEVNGLVKWGPFFDSEGRELNYTVQPPSDASGLLEFAGSISVDGRNSTIGGDQGVTISEERDEIVALRLLPDGVKAGGSVEVTISVNPGADTDVYAVEERVPSGTVVSRISDDGSFDEVNGLVKWGPFFDSEGRELNYTVQPPSDASGLLEFAGSISVDGRNSTIGGDQGVTISEERDEIVALRLLPDGVKAGGSVEVTISVNPGADTDVYAVEERVPSGTVVSAISDDGSVDDVNGLVKWGPFFDRKARELNYVITPSAESEGDLEIEGLLSFDGENVMTMGDSIITVFPFVQDSIETPLLEIGVFVGVWIFGQTGASYVIEGSMSVDSDSWIELDRIVLESSPELWIDRESADTMRRFYRARLVGTSD